jgi:hypothetical protein
MWKKLILALALVSLLGAPGVLTGCSIFADNASSDVKPPQLEVLKTMDIGNQWRVKQMRIEIFGSDKFDILYTLNEGEKIDGYFQVETEASNISFTINGNSQVFKSGASDAGAQGGVNSNRFAFTASAVQGRTYVLTYDNTTAGGGTGKDVSIYTELTYPVGSPIFIPIETTE